MLMPHSCCAPTQPNGMTSRTVIDRLNSLPRRVARLYNEWFGTPALVRNKSRAWDSPAPNITLRGEPGCEIIRLMERRGSLSLHFSELCKANALSFSN